MVKTLSDSRAQSAETVEGYPFGEVRRYAAGRVAGLSDAISLLECVIEIKEMDDE